MHNATAQGFGHCLCTIANPQLAKQIVDVGLYRAFGN